jgi:LmbE family N-acetylglucosaminyl deacetylase
MNAPVRFDYARDDARRRIRVTAHQPLEADDLIAIVDRQVREQTWTYGVLYDLRALQVARLKGDLRKVADHVLAAVTAHGRRGSVALVARAAEIVGSGQMYAFLGARIGFSVEVFWDLDEAEQWLDGQ